MAATDTSLDVTALRARFPALARTAPDGRPYVWAAAGRLAMVDSALAAITDRIRAGASNTHGVFPLSEEIDALIADARRAGADLLGCDASEIIFGQNTTSLLLHLFRRSGAPGGPATRSSSLASITTRTSAVGARGARRRGDRPWVDVQPDDVTLDLDSFDAQLTERTRLVAFTLASNAVGTIPPAAELIARAKRVGAVVAVDGVHLAQHRSIDLVALGADIVATSPYKYFGPHQGLLGVRADLLGSLEPYKLRAAPDDDPDRWESGTQNHEALAGTIAAIDYLAEIGGGGNRASAIRAGYPAIEVHEHTLARRFLQGLDRLPKVRLYGIDDPERLRERTPTFAVRVGDQHRSTPAASWPSAASSPGTGTTTRSRCSTLGLLEPGGAVRIGFCHYHGLEEVDRVLEGLAELPR